MTLRSVAIPALCVVLWLFTSCADRGSTPGASGESHPSSAAAGAKHGPVVMGEPFTVRVILDPQQGGIPVGVVVVPDKWRFESKVVWNYNYYSNPVAMSSSAVNPANEEAVFGYPL